MVTTKIYNLAATIRKEQDDNKLYKLLYKQKEYISDNIQELSYLLGESYIGKIFCVLNKSDIKFICMNTHNPLLLKYVPKEYCSDILKLFKDITPRFHLMKMYIQSYGCMQDELLHKLIFSIILNKFSIELIPDINDHAVDTLTDNEFLLIYNKYGKQIKRNCKLYDISNICFKFEHLFSDIDSNLFYHELIKDNDLLNKFNTNCQNNLKQNTYNKIQAYLVLNSIKQEGI